MTPLVIEVLEIIDIDEQHAALVTGLTLACADLTQPRECFLAFEHPSEVIEARPRRSSCCVAATSASTVRNDAW
jgi:hypothetical protein